MIEFGVDLIQIVKQTKSVKGLLLLRKELLGNESSVLSYRTRQQALELISDQLKEIDVKEMMIELFHHLL